MNKSISIKNNSLIQEDVENFLNPDYIYIPFYDTDNILVSVGKKVLKEEAIIERKNEIVYSSVSGKFIGTTESTYFDNKEGKCIVIENDFKEKVIDKKGAVKYISEYSRSIQPYKKIQYMF